MMITHCAEQPAQATLTIWASLIQQTCCLATLTTNRGETRDRRRGLFLLPSSNLYFYKNSVSPRVASIECTTFCGVFFLFFVTEFIIAYISVELSLAVYICASTLSEIIWHYNKLVTFFFLEITEECMKKNINYRRGAAHEEKRSLCREILTRSQTSDLIIEKQCFYVVWVVCGLQCYSWIGIIKP